MSGYRWAVWALVAVWTTKVMAGGGPENVVVVVNGDSWASKTVANEFVKLRGVPPGNVVVLHGLDNWEQATVEQFREDILKPALEAVQQRGIASQVDYLIYSSDIPAAIDVKEDAKKANAALPRVFTTTASINGLTYLYRYTLGMNPNYLGMRINKYVRTPRKNGEEVELPPTLGFRAAHQFNEKGEVTAEAGEKYLLSMMLGVTSGRGNSVAEVLNYLRTSAIADGTRPQGTVYFMNNSDVRSTTRRPWFDGAIAKLKTIGVQGEVLNGSLPLNQASVIGAVVGSAGFDWGKSNSKIVPGAICEHLTSFGGVMRERSGQTPLTEFLRFGAAGSSGTVTEPFAIQEKFPLPFIHYHYAQGCTLAEAFYQSVSGPYQLLIVGDPLCRPWANIPTVGVEGLKRGDVLREEVRFRPVIAGPEAFTPQRFELYVDGIRWAACQPGESFTVDTQTLDDGPHDLRIVAVEDSAIETQGRVLIPVEVQNGEARLKATLSAEKVHWEAPLKVKLSLPDAQTLSVIHQHRLLASAAGAEAELTIDPHTLGQGTSILQPVALTADGRRLLGPPLTVEVTPPPAMPGLKDKADEAVLGGLLLILPEGKTEVVKDTQPGDWLTKAGVTKDMPFELAAFFDVTADDVYQFQIRTGLKLALEIDGQAISIPEGTGTRSVPVNLAAGRHSLRFRATYTGGSLSLRFGGPGCTSLEESRFKHNLTLAPKPAS